MINKRYLKYTLLLFTFGMTACSYFLDEVNHSSQSADKYYQTKGGYESLIVGCYSNLKNIYNTTTYQIFTQQGTDVFTQNYPTEVAAMNQYTTTYQSNNGTIYAMWSSYFNALNNVNAAIDRSKSVILKTDDPDGIEPPFTTTASSNKQHLVYGNEFFYETTKYNPHSPYSASKASSDHFVRAYHDTYGMPTIAVSYTHLRAHET